MRPPNTPHHREAVESPRTVADLLDRELGIQPPPEGTEFHAAFFEIEDAILEMMPTHPDGGRAHPEEVCLSPEREAAILEEIRKYRLLRSNDEMRMTDPNHIKHSLLEIAENIRAHAAMKLFLPSLHQESASEREKAEVA